MEFHFRYNGVWSTEIMLFGEKFSFINKITSRKGCICSRLTEQPYPIRKYFC
jgi:hypothetical protein